MTSAKSNPAKDSYKSYIKKIIAGLGYSLNKIPEKSVVSTNIFNTSYKKNVLLSYIRSVFENSNSKKDNRHTNRLTTYIIAEVLSESGYNVDVINYDDCFVGDFEKYDLVIGLGKTLDMVLEARNSFSKTKVIWFGTGCNPLFSNAATIKRLTDFYNKHHKLILQSSRYIKEDWVLQHEFADWIILHGNAFAKSTYRKNNISTIHAPVFINHIINRSDAEWTTAKQNYLWFGSDGAIHKGLDIVIDSIKETANCTLHICGNLENEADFFNIYGPIIKSSYNITYHGFVNIESDSFKKILENCAFIIYPSASEGNSPAVITCMANGGLIPVVSENTDIDITDFGILINDLNTDSVKNSIQQSQKLSVSELKSQSSRIISKTHDLNSFEHFEKDFKLKLQEALKAI